MLEATCFVKLYWRPEYQNTILFVWIFEVFFFQKKKKIFFDKYDIYMYVEVFVSTIDDTENSCRG